MQRGEEDHAEHRHRLLTQESALYGTTPTTPVPPEDRSQSPEATLSSPLASLAASLTVNLQGTPRPETREWTSLAALAPTQSPQRDIGGPDSPRHAVELQFASPFFYVNKNEPQVVLDVFCLKEHTEPCVVRYKTHDGRAKAGQHYIPAEGELIFEESVYCQKIVIRLVNDGSWATTVEFHVSLHPVANCAVCKHLRHTRVRIVSHDLFPDNKFRDDIESGRLLGRHDGDHVSHMTELSLMCSYILWNDHVPGVRTRVILILILDQLHSVYAFLILWLEVYMIDRVLNHDPKTDREHLWFKNGPYNGKLVTACVVASCYVLPLFVLHLWDYIKLKRISITSLVRVHLQGQLFSRFVNIKEESRHKVSPSRMAQATIIHAASLANGLDSLLGVAQHIGRLLALVSFLCYMNRRALPFVVIMPILTALWSLTGASTRSQQQQHTSKEMMRLADFLVEIAESHTAVTGYAREEATGNFFRSRLDIYGAALKDLKLHGLADQYFGKWLDPLCIGVYICTNVQKVFSGDMLIGRFLAGLRTLHQTSATCASIYAQLIHAVEAIRPLEEITDILSQPSMNHERQKNAEMVQVETKTQLGLATGIPQPFRVPRSRDTLEIELRNVSFWFGQTCILEKACVAVKQGGMVAVVGKGVAGKHTLLRLLAGTLCPTSGLVFVPAHVKKLLVTREPVMLDGTIFDNLAFGIGSTPAAMSRVKKIAERFRIPTATFELQRLQEQQQGTISSPMGRCETLPTPVRHPVVRGVSAKSVLFETDVNQPRSMAGTSWKACLAASELAKIHLARALVANPEVLILHRPFGAFAAEEADRIFDIVRNHVVSRGLSFEEGIDEEEDIGSDPENNDSGRPVTCFFTPQNLGQASKADVIWHVKDRVVEQVRPEDVTVDMLV